MSQHLERAAASISVEAVISLFNHCFERSENTILIGGASEPFYAPASAGRPAEIRFRDDYLRSALHEVAHWCHAGRRRRQLPDYGYWYTPDDRNADQQAAFFSVEARPQAIERCFCEEIGLPFRASVDNLSLQISDEALEAFNQRLNAVAARYREQGLPPRAAQFASALGTWVSQG